MDFFLRALDLWFFIVVGVSDATCTIEAAWILLLDGVLARGITLQPIPFYNTPFFDIGACFFTTPATWFWHRSLSALHLWLTSSLLRFRGNKDVACTLRMVRDLLTLLSRSLLLPWHGICVTQTTLSILHLLHTLKEGEKMHFLFFVQQLRHAILVQ